MYIVFNMNEKRIKEKLNQIKIEDYIWIIYIGIIILSFYSNYLESNYFKYNDIYSKEKYQKIMIFIFSILVIVYYYFLDSSYKDFKGLKEYDTDKKKILVSLSFLGSLFIFVSGVIFLYIALNDESLDVEIAFN